jgi:hypothetical protein
VSWSYKNLLIGAQGSLVAGPKVETIHKDQAFKRGEMMIQRNADHRSPINFSSDASLRSGRPPSGSEPKLKARCWPFPAAARFTVAGSGNVQDSGAACQPASSFIT